MSPALIQEQADKIGVYIVDTDGKTSETRKFNINWLKWISQEKIPYDERSVPEHILRFLSIHYQNNFKEVLAEIKKDDGSFSVNELVGLMSPAQAESVKKQLGMNFNLESIIQQQSPKQGFGNKVADMLLERYGFDLNNLDSESVDFADIMHAAYFNEFPKVAESHHVYSVLKNFLSSSRSGKKKQVVDPKVPSIDSIMAFFNGYNDIKAIENVLVEIEKRKITKEISRRTKDLQKSPRQYHHELRNSLHEIITNLEEEKKNSKLEGSKRVLTTLIDRYSGMRDFDLEGIRKSLHGQAFPRFYQIEAIQEICKKKRFLIADEMGTGKTAIAVLAAEYISQQEDRPDFKTLIVTTNSNKNSFKEKISDYLRLSKKDKEQKIAVLNGWDRHEKYDNLDNKRYVVINYELLRAKDWKIEDYQTWEVPDERSLEIRADIEADYKRYRESGKSKTKEDFLRDSIKRSIGKKRADSLENKLNKLYDAYIKIQDLNHAKSVVKSIRRNFNYDYLVFDEIQNAKNPASQNSKSVLELAGHAEYLTCLTGTPFVNGLSDMSSLFSMLGIYDDILKDKNTELRRKEKELGIKKEVDIEKLPENSQKEVLKLRKEKQDLESAIEKGDIKTLLLENPRIVRDYLKPRMVHRKTKDVLPMPELNFIPELEKQVCYDNMISLGMYQCMIYQILSMHNFKNSSDQLRGLQMFLLSGGLYKKKFNLADKKYRSVPKIPEELTRYLTDEDSVKYKALEKLVRDITANKDAKKRNVIIFSSLYKENVTKYLQERLSNICDCLRVDGEVKNTKSYAERDEVLEQFNNSKKPTALVATLPTLKEAVELQKNCSNVIFLDLPFTWAAYIQAVARVWRADQNEPVNVYNLLVSNTLDIGKLELILEKKRVGDLFLAGSPLNRAELELLDLNEAKAASVGFLEKYLERNTDSAMKIMRDLFGKGANLTEKVLGEKNRRSEIYADAYLLNVMSLVNTLRTCHTLKDLGLLDERKKESLDGKVLDLAAGYGTFAHATGIKTENLEVNPFMVERAADYAPSAHYTKGLMQNVNEIYGNNHFKAIIHNLAFHYASEEERGKLLHDIHKTLKKGGYLLLTETYKSSEKGGGSIDDEGAERLKEALKYTGFTVEKAGVVESAGKKFYSIVAKNSGKTRLYKSPLVLREYLDDKANPDGINKEDYKAMYASAKMGKSKDPFLEKLKTQLGPEIVSKLEHELM